MNKMKLDKESNLYERTEVIANAIRGKRNLCQQDTATITLLTVLNEVADSGKSIDELLDDSAESKAWRIRIRDEIKPTHTAAKNFQNSYCVDSGLLPKATGSESVEEFV